MTNYNIRTAELADVAALGDNIRDLDKEEVNAASAHTPTEALQRCFKSAVEAFTAEADGSPFCMFGVSPLSHLGGGSPWLLTSSDILKHKRQLIKFSAPVAHYWRDNMFQYLLNFIDVRHKPAIRWAKHIGFEIRDPIPYGYFDMPFHPIIMRR